MLIQRHFARAIESSLYMQSNPSWAGICKRCSACPPMRWLSSNTAVAGPGAEQHSKHKPHARAVLIAALPHAPAHVVLQERVDIQLAGCCEYAPPLHRARFAVAAP